MMDNEYEFTHGLLKGMRDSPLKNVSLNESKEIISFEFEDGKIVRFGVDGDCCSTSQIEHIDIPPYVIGEKIISVEETTMEVEADPEVYECLQVYNTKFRTPKGDIVLEYRNESNGYYGGYLVRLDE